jgi:molecular chaperone DnaK
LSDSEIDRMVKAAEQHASEDKNRREQIEQRNQLDSLIYRVEKDSKEWVDRLPAEAKGRLDSALEGAKGALRSGDADLIRKGLDELNAAYSAAGATLYQGAQAQGGEPSEGATGQQSAGQTPGQDDVVEADYEIVDDKK